METPTMETSLIVEFISRNNFKLKEDFCFKFSANAKLDSFFWSWEDTFIENYAPHFLLIRVPKGFYTDFGSIPQFFQSFISPIGSPTKAYVLHDYLLYLWEIEIIPNRKLCDKTFREALKELGVGIVRRHIMYLAVRAYSTYQEKKRSFKNWLKKIKK